MNKLVQQYINRIHNTEKKRYAADYATDRNIDSGKYNLSAMGKQAVRMSIDCLLDMLDNRKCIHYQEPCAYRCYSPETCPDFKSLKEVK